LNQNGLSEKIWQLENENKLALKDKIEKDSITLMQTQTVKIFRGVTTGFNPAFIINEEKRNELVKADKANASIIKKMLQGRNIRKWVYNKTTDYLIFTRKGIEIKKYPIIEKHLNVFRESLEPGVGRKPGSYNWYEIQDNTAYYAEFEKEKIIWGLTSDKWTFAYDNQGNFLPSNGYILTSTDLPIKYLLGVLNSRLMEFYFDFIGIMTAGGAYTLKYETVIEFPIKIANDKIQKQFICLIELILLLKNEIKDSTFFERLIDAMVYELYFPDEIKAAGAEVLKHLGNLPDVGADDVRATGPLRGHTNHIRQDKRMIGAAGRPLQTIEKVHKELSAPNHPVSIAMEKQKTVPEVRIIEGLDK
jgi:hypothetical protein